MTFNLENNIFGVFHSEVEKVLPVLIQLKLPRSHSPGLGRKIPFIEALGIVGEEYQFYVTLSSDPLRIRLHFLSYDVLFFIVLFSLLFSHIFYFIFYEGHPIDCSLHILVLLYLPPPQSIFLFYLRQKRLLFFSLQYLGPSVYMA